MVLRFFRPFLPGGLPRLGAIPGASEPPKIVLSSLVSASICSRRPTARRSCASDKSDNAFAIAVISHENVREVNFAPANRNAPLLFAIHGDGRLHFGPIEVFVLCWCLRTVPKLAASAGFAPSPPVSETDALLITPRGNGRPGRFCPSDFWV